MGNAESPASTSAPPAYDEPASSSQPAPVFSSSVSLHSLDPPQYHDDPEDDTPETNQYHYIPGALKPTKDGNIRTLDTLLSRDASVLFAVLQAQAKIPPHPVVRVTGTHREVVTRDNKEQETTVTDFDIQVDCSYIFTTQEQDVEVASEWHTFEVVGDTELALRGGLFKRRLREPGLLDPENVLTMNTIDRIRLWCHSFCAAASHRWFPLVFIFRRRLLNWDTDSIEKHLTASVRATGYRGTISTSFDTQNPGFTVYSSHWMNRARNNNWIWWICVILPLWIICWPTLLLCTGTFDGISSLWFFKKVRQVTHDNSETFYASEREQEWLQKWGEAITEAAFARRQDWLHETDVLAMRRERDRMHGRQQSRQTGNAFVDTAVGVFTGIHGAVRDSDRIMGWGGDTLPRKNGFHWSTVRTPNTGC